MSALLQDLRYALRLLMKNPGFALTAALIMALGIGANTAIFSIVNKVLIEPLPYRDADRIVQIWHTPPQSSFPGMSTFAISPANFLDWQKQSRLFDKMAIYTGAGVDITGAGKPESIPASPVSTDFFSALGVQPIHGRVFSPDENNPGQNHVVVLSYKFWQTHYANDPGAVGKTINLDGDPYTIVGVMGPAMNKPGFARIWVPVALTPAAAAVRNNHNYLAVGRLKPGVTVEQAQAEMNTISQRLEQAYPAEDKGWGVVIHPLRDETVGDIRPALLMMLGAVAFVLLIACANVANLLLARTFSRRKEIAIRTAMGALRSRIIQQLLGESVLISIIGGALGLLAAHFGIQLLLKLFANQLPQLGDIGLSAPVLAFTFVLSIATGVLAGLLPALNMTKGDVNTALKQGLGRTDAVSGSSATRSALVVVEVALSLVLLIGAGLMVRSLWKLQTIDPGFDQHNVLTMNVKVNKKLFASATEESQFFDQVLSRIRALPGVESAGAIDDLPLNGGSNQPVAVEGRPVVALSEQPEVSVRVVTSGYFSAMRIPLLQGRAITDDDRAASAPVVVISQSMAKQFWPNSDAIGHHLKLSFFPDKDRQIVGIVGDVKQTGLNNSTGIASLYWPAAQVSTPSQESWRSVPLALAVRTTVAPRTLATAITDAVHQVNKDVPVDNVLTLEEFVEETLSQNSANMQLLSIFGLLALVLSTVGIYSVLAYSVKRGMKDIGLRIAFGATRSDVMQFVVTQAIKPTAIGIVIGLVAAYSLSRLVKSMVYGVSAHDTLTFVAVTVLLVLVAFVASLVPALRATRISPL
ncbi:MAG TPA: ABC transporter permease, partial [Edaphobacter sp.]|nr:ABC transporter permease [Edaphobacter sp.]